MRNAVASGGLDKNFRFGLKRIFDTEFSLEQAGKTLKTKNIVEKAAEWNYAFKKTLADRAVVKALSDLKTTEGDPKVLHAGFGDEVKGDEAKNLSPAVFIKPQVGARSAAYIKSNIPAMRNWKFIKTLENGTKVILNGDALLHTSIAQKIENRNSQQSV